MDWNKDKWQSGEAEHPQYVVIGEKVGTPFYDFEYAFMWYGFLVKKGVEVINLIDLTDYDWETNLANIKFHKTNDFIKEVTI